MRPYCRRAASKEAAKAAFGKTLRSWLDYIGAAELADDVLAAHGIGSIARRAKT